MRFAALGRTQLLYDAIQACVEEGHQCALIATAPERPEYTRGAEDFRQLAERLECGFLNRSDLRPSIDVLTRSRADVAISVNWPTLLPSAVRDAFHLGVVNAHAGDLPRYRGNACPNWAILRGEPEVVVTLHVMVDELDAGPVLLKDSYRISSDTYIGDVYGYLERTVPGLFATALNGLDDGSVAPVPQPSDPALSLRCLPRTPADGALDWRCAAAELGRLVRASAEPFAGAFGFLDGKRVTVWRARPHDTRTPLLGICGQVVEIRDSGEVLVLTGDGLLGLQEVETDGEGRGPASAAIRSTRMRFTPADPTPSGQA